MSDRVQDSYRNFNLGLNLSNNSLTPRNWEIKGVGDFNGDRKTDILWRNQETGDNKIWLMDGTEFTEDIAIAALPDLDWKAIAASDFNGDRKVDILWRNQKTGDNKIWLMDGTKFTEDITIGSLKDVDWEMRGVGDFNRDKKTDILWRNQKTGDNKVWLMDGTKFIEETIITPNLTDLNWTILGSGNFNNDNNSDLLWRNSVTKQNAIWLMDGTNVPNPEENGVYIKGIVDPEWEVPNAEEIWEMVGAGDFNNDDHSDILWRNNVTKENAISLMDGTKITKGVYITSTPDLAGQWWVRGFFLTLAILVTYYLIVFLTRKPD